MNIEDVAKEDPSAILTLPIDYSKGLSEQQATEFATKLGFKGDQIQQASKIMVNLYKLYRERDATQVEINPLATTEDGAVLCMDAKLGFDDNASFRQEEVFKLRDVTQENPVEVEAAKAELNFIKLDGNIGCLVNGAGLAMATLVITLYPFSYILLKCLNCSMDVLKLHGGQYYFDYRLMCLRTHKLICNFFTGNPANFLDVGGSATPEAVKKAFELLLLDKNVASIFVNVSISFLI